MINSNLYPDIVAGSLRGKLLQCADLPHPAGRGVCENIVPLYDLWPSFGMVRADSGGELAGAEGQMPRLRCETISPVSNRGGCEWHHVAVDSGSLPGGLAYGGTLLQPVFTFVGPVGH